MQSSLRLVSILAALSLGAFAFAADKKADDAKSCKDCAPCCKESKETAKDSCCKKEKSPEKK